MTLRYKLASSPSRLPAPSSAAAAPRSRSIPNAPVSTNAARRHHVYKQIELLSRPAVKEAFEMFEDHNKTNRSEPYADPVLKSRSNRSR